MRAQLASRLVAGLRAHFGSCGQDGAQAFRMLASNAVSGDAASSLQKMQHGAGHEGFNVPKLGQPMSMTFASQMHSLSKEEDRSSAPGMVSPLLAKETPKALMALPARPLMKRPVSAVQRAMGTAAAAHEEEHVPMHKAHPFHVLPPSPWPALAGYGAFTSMLGMTCFFHSFPHGTALMMTGILSTALTAITWWRDCIIESDMGMHTEVVKRNLMKGVWLFIVSEAALFFGLLWACVDLGMSPTVHVQMQWPPVGIEAIGWDKRALVMSAVLAGSYYSANVAMVAKDPKTVMAALGTTIGLGLLFIGDQYLEYSTAPFTITDGPYGTTFFITTGFHGMHVILGAIWLIASMAMYPRYKNPGVGMKGAILYWHFVDIVWIAVYGIIYVAGL